MRFVDDQHSRLGRTARHGPDLLYRMAERERCIAEAALRAEARAGGGMARAGVTSRVRLQCPIRLRSPIRVVPADPGR